MRSFLPIKGPDGRNLTQREKVALAVLALTLGLCVLTLLSGTTAYTGASAHNPVLSAATFPSRLFGGGIVGLYGIVLIWSALVYVRGEWVTAGRSVWARGLATLGIGIGLSGVLGVAQFETAGMVGAAVGGALLNTFGGILGTVVLLALVFVAASLAAEGAWTALRGPVQAGSTLAAEDPWPPLPTEAGTATALNELAGRSTGESPMPDDGDPSAEDRTLAVTQAMEEIERSQGVRIVTVDEDAAFPAPTPEPAADAFEEDADAWEEESGTMPPHDRASIGEEVDRQGHHQAGTEEAEVEDAVAHVLEAIDTSRSAHEEQDEDDADEEVAPMVQADGAGEAYEPYAVEERELPAPPPRAAADPEFERDAEGTEAEEFLRLDAAMAERAREEEEAEEEDFERPGFLDRIPERERDEPQVPPHDKSATYDWRGRPLE